MTAINDAPVAVDDIGDDGYETNEDTTLIIYAEDGVLANDTDIENDNLTVEISGAIILPSHAASFSLDLDDGSFTYTPENNWCGTDTFTYNAFDGTDSSEFEALVEIKVICINDAQVITLVRPDAKFLIRVNSNGQDTNDILSDTTDVDGTIDRSTLAITSGLTPSGFIVINPDFTVTYIAKVGVLDTLDEFSFRVKDDQGLLSNEMTIRVFMRFKEILNEPIEEQSFSDPALQRCT